MMISPTDKNAKAEKLEGKTKTVNNSCKNNKKNEKD
jgi:hypothetical protein